MSRAIDADALEKEGWSLHRSIRVDKNAEEYQTKPINAPTIESQRIGRWIHDGYAFKGGIDWMHCSECGHKDSWSVATRTPFCGWCGARMGENNEGD